MGGDGGAGGVGGNVDLNLDGGDVTTLGDNSHALFAQSVGGGGGSGGFAVSGGISGGASVSLGIGGTGGAGADADGVTVKTSDGVIATGGDRSYGLLAQSVGGGGGDGGFAVAGGISSAPSINLSMGGDGGVGGNGAEVDVTNGSVVTTGGAGSHALFAQSVGGGGGSGGFSVGGGVSWGGSSISTTFGGEGESGGFGGNVGLTNNGTLTTSGDDAYGILAQSVGGGGGDGGMAFSGSLAGSGAKSVSFTLGGGGGEGGAAGTVDVENSGVVDTSGGSAHGILAQSIGGSGGNGGMAVSLALATSGTPGVYNVNVASSVGGGGGDGGFARAVQVNNYSNIITRGESSHGIFGQSVGGGGGTGGASLSVAGGWNPAESNVVNVSLSVGGEGGDGNNGGAVNVVNNGSIETVGQASYGINAQSVGGGGGIGGDSSALTVSLDPQDYTSDTNFFSMEKTLVLAMGGNGGGASDGGLASVTNVGTIVTRGNDAYGIFVETVGGGGGVGGAAEHDPPLEFLGPAEDAAAAILEAYEAFDKFDTLQITLGGRGGSSGDGGDAIVQNDGSIETFGHGADGIFAQSIGGGGGVGGRGAPGLTGTIGIGGAAGTTGDGGRVAVDQMGNITTQGINSHAITAQSAGGGGGMGGSVDRGLFALDFGVNIAYGNGGGNGGNGGDIDVTSSGQITTSGTASYGVFAQSVGGGGGVAGEVGNVPGFAGSTGGYGRGGDLSLEHDGDITTLGDASHGIFAQSAGGTTGSTTNGINYVGMGGNIEITVTGDVTADGEDAHGILAISTGEAGVGDISINILGGGTVHGGSSDSAGIRLVGGANNTVTNRGEITTLNGSTGVAILGGSGNDRVENFGTLIGQVLLGEGNNSWINHAGSVFTVETTFDLGAGNTLENVGLLTGTGEIIGNVSSSGEIRAGNSPGRITIDGSLSLTESAGMFFEVGGTGQGVGYDHVEVTSFAELAGTLSLSLDNNFVPSSNDTFTLLSADSLSGLFGNAANGTRIATTDNLGSFEVNYTATSVEVSAYQSPDTDGDGMSDYEESLAGTDWLDDESVLAVSTVVRNGLGQVLLQFSRVVGRDYVIEYTDDLAGGIWNEVTSPEFTYPDADTAQWVDDGTHTGEAGGDILFYRVRLDL